MIFKDRRHTECTVVMDVPSDRRLYRDWDMRVEDMHAIALLPGLPGPVWFQGAWAGRKFGWNNFNEAGCQFA